VKVKRLVSTPTRPAELVFGLAEGKTRGRPPSPQGGG
jgi:hypothetical protein